MRIIAALGVALLLSRSVTGQAPPSARTGLSIMVIPFSSGGDQKVKYLLEHDSTYRQAISYINSALIDMGYSKTLDFLTFKEITDKKIKVTEDEAWSDRAKRYIEQAPVDIIIETDLTWIDPKERPHDRQAIIRLKAVDKYSGMIYANAPAVQTAQREFPDMLEAMDCALNRDGRPAFQKFLAQLDSSCGKLPKAGRMTTIKFETGSTSPISLYDSTGGETLIDKIEAFVKGKAFHALYEMTGFSAKYMELKVQLPVYGNSPASTSVSSDFNRDLNIYLRQWGLKAECIAIGQWLNFMLQRTDR